MSKRELNDKIRTVISTISNNVGKYDDDIVVGVNLAHEVITHIIDDYFRSEGLQ